MNYFLSFTVAVFFAVSCNSSSDLTSKLAGQPTANDSDGDSVSNLIDRCDSTPDGESVNSFGCPDLDSDKDGVEDIIDRCPGTPIGESVFPNGCVDHIYQCEIRFDVPMPEGDLWDTQFSQSVQWVNITKAEAKAQCDDLTKSTLETCQSSAQASLNKSCTVETSSLTTEKLQQLVGCSTFLCLMGEGLGGGSGTGGTPSPGGPPCELAGTPIIPPTVLAGASLTGGPAGGPTSPCDPGPVPPPSDEITPTPIVPPTVLTGGSLTGGGLASGALPDDLDSVLVNAGLDGETAKPFWKKLYPIAKSLAWSTQQLDNAALGAQASSVLQNSASLAKSLLIEANASLNAAQYPLAASQIYLSAYLADVSYKLVQEKFAVELANSSEVGRQAQDLYEAFYARSLASGADISADEQSLILARTAKSDLAKKAFPQAENDEARLALLSAMVSKFSTIR